MYLNHNIFIIEDINDREGVLNTLNGLYTDGDFLGINGAEYLWEEASESGFESNQGYTIDILKNSGLKGEELVVSFLHQWLDNDCYYGEWTMETAKINDGKGLAVSYAVVCNG